MANHKVDLLLKRRVPHPETFVGDFFATWSCIFYFDVLYICKRERERERERQYNIINF